ncbi:MAG: T9SS type A sorting domain-containing protein [Bacteroidales bacterium]|nr:T9SS type A sorting domain-containing protein [Bacteroidales bacterium]MCF8391159.1 T9SS type A sorting domain-containing protein [Bacteroidales bacterium]
MEVKIFDTKGNMVAERQYFAIEKKTPSQFLLNESEPGVYIVNIIIDGIVKTRKMRMK